MTGRTHKEFAISFVYFATFWIYSHRLLDINYYCLLVIMLAIGAKGALFPDVDHVWTSVKEKTLFNRILNILIHITGGKHRSWQTHSIDICLASMVGFLALNKHCFTTGIIDNLNYQVIEMILLAFYSGWISHLLSDMLTVGGVYIAILGMKKVRIVPKRIGNLEFKTGDKWELWVYKFVNRVNMVMSVVAILYPFVFDVGMSEWLLQYI